MEERPTENENFKIRDLPTVEDNNKPSLDRICHYRQCQPERLGIMTIW